MNLIPKVFLFILSFGLASNLFAQNSFLNPTTLGSNTTPNNPIIVGFNNQLYVAWQGDDRQVNYIVSNDGGKTFPDQNKRTFGLTDTAPFLFTFNGGVYISWWGQGNSFLNIANITNGGFNNWTVNNKLSSVGASLVQLNNRLYLACISQGPNPKICIYYSTDGGKSFPYEIPVKDTSDNTPYLAVHNNNLYVAWTGNRLDAQHLLNVAMVTDGGLVQKNTIYTDWSNLGVSMASINGVLYLCWTGNDGHMYLLPSFDNGNSFDQNSKARLDDTSGHTPSITASQNGLFCTWDTIRPFAPDQMHVGEFNVPIANGSVRPKYSILTVLYAPPGSSVNKASSVDYTDSKTTGTSTSISKSFTTSTDIQLSGGKVATASAGFSISSDLKDSHSFDVTNTSSSGLNVVNDSMEDGIDHKYDRIVIWLNPKIVLTKMGDGSFKYLPVNDGKGMDYQDLKAIWLMPNIPNRKASDQMPSMVSDYLKRFNITSDDYQNILSSDPFLKSSTTTLDTNRFIYQSSVMYEPNTQDTAPFTLKTDTSTTDTQETDQSYSVSLSIGANFPFGPSFKDTEKFTWDYNSKMGSSLDSQKTAILNLSSPGTTFSGTTLVDVYWDTIFNSFYFQFNSDPKVVDDVLLDRNEKPLKNALVTLKAGKITKRTFTNSIGHYQFNGKFSGTGIVKVKAIKNYSKKIIFNP